MTRTMLPSSSVGATPNSHPTVTAGDSAGNDEGDTCIPELGFCPHPSDNCCEGLVCVAVPLSVPPKCMPMPKGSSAGGDGDENCLPERMACLYDGNCCEGLRCIGGMKIDGIRNFGYCGYQK